jgi:hypothetical protein
MAREGQGRAQNEEPAPTAKQVYDRQMDDMTRKHDEREVDPRPIPVQPIAEGQGAQGMQLPELTPGPDTDAAIAFVEAKGYPKEKAIQIVRENGVDTILQAKAREERTLPLGPKGEELVKTPVHDKVWPAPPPPVHAKQEHPLYDEAIGFARGRGYTEEAAQQIVREWGVEGVLAARDALGIDRRKQEPKPLPETPIVSRHGEVFDPNVHAVHRDGLPATDSTGRFMLKEHFYAPSTPNVPGGR